MSPCLFNLYMSSIPVPKAPLKLVSYADDCTVLASGRIIDDLFSKLNEYLSTLAQWFRKNDLELSIFNTFSNEVNKALDLKINDEQIPMEKKPKILGVYFDPMQTFKRHAKETAQTAKKRNNVLRAIAGSTWGKDKEQLLNMYKATGRAVLNYGAPVWTPNLSASNWSALQCCQNQALRTATGCVKMAAPDDLHYKTKFRPVKNHELLAKKHLLKAQWPSKLRNHVADPRD